MFNIQPKELIIDTGFFVALFYRNDKNHQQALDLRPKIEHKRWITTWPVITETCHLLQNQEGVSGSALHQLLQMYQNDGFEIFNISICDMPRVQQLIKKYQTLPLDLADASLLILAEHLGHGQIVSTDTRDFSTYRWKNHKPFHNLCN